MANWRVRPGWHFNWEGRRLEQFEPVPGISDEEANRYANLEIYEEKPHEPTPNRRAKPKAPTPGIDAGDNQQND
jgi:hypothetical protein